MANGGAGYEQLDGYVTDNANQITSEYKALIINKVTQIEQNTSIEIAILTVPSLNGQSIEQFSIDTAQGNGVGKKGKDNGLLITVAQKERKWRIEVGYGLEGIITDAQAKIIGERYLKPELASGNWGGGLLDTLNQIEIEINKEPTSEPITTIETTKTDLGVSATLVFGLLVIFMVLFIIPIGNTSEDNSKRKYSGSYHSSGRRDSEDNNSLESDIIHHSYYSGGYDSGSSSSDSGSSSFGGGSFGGGGASGGF